MWFFFLAKQFFGQRGITVRNVRVVHLKDADLSVFYSKTFSRTPNGKTFLIKKKKKLTTNNDTIFCYTDDNINTTNSNQYSVPNRNFLFFIFDNAIIHLVAFVKFNFIKTITITYSISSKLPFVFFSLFLWSFKYLYFHRNNR